MTEFPGTDGGQIAYEVTGLTAAARWDGLRANMSATLRAIKAAAESSHAGDIRQMTRSTP